MAVILNTPFSWENAVDQTAQMLDELQPNILRSHTREFLTLIFLEFTEATGAANLLSSLAMNGIVPAPMKSARAHMQEVKAFKADGTKGTPYVGVGLAQAGYEFLGIPLADCPPDPSFQGGMKTAALNDPPVEEWEPVFQETIHAVILVGDQMRDTHDQALSAMEQRLAAAVGVRKLGDQAGLGQHNGNKDGIEHFGYVDGRSQPLFTIEEIEEERLGTDGAHNWDPGFAPERVIVPDPAAPDPSIHFGSYFVFRKLEQNVKAFKEAEKALAKALDLQGDDIERAGAMVIGRFEDGTPLAVQFAEGTHNPVPNDFNYDSDTDGGKCPFFGHIRKVNPRGSGGFEPSAKERLHIMPRRGQTYGIRTDDLNDGRTDNKPTNGVGLLFMAFNCNLAEQFEFAQSFWANSPGFPKVPAGANPPGLDLVIGQGVRPDIACPVKWADPPAKHVAAKALPQTVTMLGGEYFFMPSLAFLRSLKTPAARSGAA